MTWLGAAVAAAAPVVAMLTGYAWGYLRSARARDKAVLRLAAKVAVLEQMRRAPPHPRSADRGWHVDDGIVVRVVR